MYTYQSGQRTLRRRRERFRRRLARGAVAALAVAALGIGALGIGARGIRAPDFAGDTTRAPLSASAHPSATGMFPDSVQPTVAVDPDRVPVELGLNFSTQRGGTVTAVQYFQSPAQSGVTSATLWTSTGKVMARAQFDASGVEGWRTIPLSSPVSLIAGGSYVVSYHAAKGSYAVAKGDVGVGKSRNGFVINNGAGVYKYGKSGFPTRVNQSSGYLVDIVFTPRVKRFPAPDTALAPLAPEGAQRVPTAVATPTPTPSRDFVHVPAPSPDRTLVHLPAPTPLLTPPASSDAPAQAPPYVPTPGDPGWSVTTSTVGLAPLGLSCGSLALYTGPSSVPSGTVISGKLITGGLDLSAGGITIEKSCIQPTSAGRGLPVIATQSFNTFAIASSKVTIRNSEFDGSRLGIEDAAWATAFIGVADLSSNYIHGFGSGIGIMNSGPNLDITVERNYVTGLVAWGNPATTGNHSDAFTIRDFSASSRADRTLTVVNNRFNSNSGSDTGALFIQTYSGRIDNVLIQGNLLEGNGYQLGLNQMNDPYSNLRSVNNRFSGTGYGATYVQNGPGWAQWDSNFLYQATAAYGKGAAIQEP